MHCKLGCAIRVCAFNLGTQEEMEVISESEVSLVCKASSRTVSTVAQRNSVLKKTEKKKKVYNPLSLDSLVLGPFLHRLSVSPLS